MDIEIHEKIMKENGFIKIASIDYEFNQALWWHPTDKLEISIINMDPFLLLKGSKPYFMKAITPEGELYIRDLNPFHEYLESHLSEFCVSFSYIRDIKNTSLILQRIKDKKLRYSSKDEDSDLSKKEADLERIREEFILKKNDLANTKALLNLTRGRSSLANEYLKMKFNRSKSELEEISTKGRNIEKDVSLNYKLINEYRKKGSGAAFVFSYSSDLLACYVEGFKDALFSTVKDIKDMHNYQIRQKLFGGKLNIYVEEIEHPALAYQNLWAGGVLNPDRLANLGPHFDELRRCSEKFFMVTPSKNITVDGITKDEKKLVAAKVLQNFLRRLDIIPNVSIPREIPRKGGWIGNIIKGNDVTDVPFFYPVRLGHGYVSGTTTAGKTFLARVIVENSIIEGVVVIVLDPGQQWFGLTRPAIKESVLKRYDQLGISREYARGFGVRIYIPGRTSNHDLPENLNDLFKWSSVISFRLCNDLERCRITRNILKTVYDSLQRESDKLQILIVLEEAHLFTQSGVLGEAKEAAQEVGIYIKRIAREKAKFGCNLKFISQSLSDFRRDEKIVREMVNSRFFLRATDNAELDYIENYVSREAREVVKNLGQGEALVHGYAISASSGVKVFVRPPFSHVGELSEAELNEIINAQRAQIVPEQERKFDRSIGEFNADFSQQLSEREREALKIVKEWCGKHHRPITAIELGHRMGLQGGSRQRLIDSLVEKGFVVTTKIPNIGRGRPVQGIAPMD